uniref:NADH:ubiquinone reductase (H(+)-translocating) n=1 Tax=Apharyngostrigea pipientis TaxID=234879 RepID=A0A8A2H902_9TREM|nr:NADH dehydrogenase subunit 5 [Apharyngostrigea pipientis]QSV37708.1 NADH dehydrogenase subunit 5 [Apharyngostrigea pipientis]
MVLGVISCFLSGLLGLLVLWVWNSSLGVVISFFPWSFGLNDLEFLGCFSYITALCLLMLSICSILAFIYCFHYFHGASESLSLFYLMVWFVLVMGILMCSGSLVSTLFMWEYLGFVSFLLILFYSNSDSVRASLITLFSSRFGDVGLFVLIACCWFDYSLSVFFSFFFFLVVISKSAGFPFISWLLEAMRAPTPVSSLVHSSTLVAAGVWFVLSYGLVFESDFYLFFVFVSSLLTIMVTGLCALFFLDLKKIVALSTCNNIAWCLVYYACGDLALVAFQLVVHGICKCVLFILVGDLMSFSGGSQSSVGVYMVRYGGSYCVVLLVFIIFSLCGVPFLGIFFSKHFFFSSLVGSFYNVFLVSLVLFSLLLSYAYSFRLSLLVCSLLRGLPFGYFISFLFVGLFVLLGTIVSWLVFGCFEEYVCLSSFWSLSFLLVQIIGCFLGYFIYSLRCDSSFWWFILCGSDSLVGLCYSFYSYVIGVSLVALYRWEVFLFNYLGRLFGGFVGVSLFIFSLNFVVLGIFSYIVFCMLV